MTDTLPLDQLLAAPPRRDRRIGVFAMASFGLHVLVIGLLLLPALQRLQQPDPPPTINVELVPPSALPSDPPPSSEAPSSAPPPSSEAPVSSEQPSMELAPSGASEPPSSAQTTAAASAPAEGSSQAPPPSAASEAPVPAPRPLLIPVTPDEPSSEAPSTAGDASTLDPSAASDAGTSSAPPERPLALATTGPGADEIAPPSSAPEEPSAASAEVASEQPPPPKIDGALHVAKKFYLANMLRAPAMASAREAITKLPPQKRLVQTCNIEAIAQIGQSSSRYQPDALVADAFAPPQPAGTTLEVPAGAFRSAGIWHAVSYACTLSKDMSRVESFSFRIGGEVALPSRAPAQLRRQGV